MDNPVFKVGEKIICINDNFDKTAYGAYLMVAWPKRYEIYTVRAIHELQNSIFLNELVNNSDSECREPSFFNFRFRKAIIDDYQELHKHASIKKEPIYEEAFISI